MQARALDGTFKRTRMPWSPDDWDNGYHDNRGRFRVYRPDYPNSYEGGYAMRAHVVWWLETCEPHPKGTILHHINGIKDDDRFENLELMEHGEHTREHCQLPDIELLCENCRQGFCVRRAKFNSRLQEGTPIKFCSQACFHSYPKKKIRITIICEECQREFLVIPSRKNRRFCSNKCSAKFIWRERKS